MKPIFPEPKEMCLDGGVVALSGANRVIQICERFPSALAEAAHKRLRRRIEELGGQMIAGADMCGSIELVVRRPKLDIDHDQKMDFATANRDQAYILEIDEQHGAVITASDGPGLLYGVVTLCQLMERRGEEIVVPCGTVHDFPDMKYRGLFAESRWGMDLMTLQDWKDAVDYLVDMKCNTLTVGVYNCWPAQYGDVSEWMMLPISSLPKLKKKQFIDYYSAKAGEWQHLKYLPKMYEDDFFGELVAYGTGRGMIVRPHFNTPGHNSLIPRLMPETSARDADGNPTGYGFCLSCEETYEVMFKIIDEIVDRYLLPNGCSAYHIAADEVYPLVGMHPDKLYERLSPWCQCDRCGALSEGENYVQYIERIVEHLHGKGITLIGMWYDQLVRGGVLNEDLTKHFEKIGARDSVVLHWWDYGDFFETTHPELGFRRWVTPMTGYFYQTPYRGHLNNIYLAERLGQQEGCEGTESYGVFDPAFHRHFAAQSEWSWNFEGGGPQESFKLKYAQALFGEQSGEGPLGLEMFQTLVDDPASANLVYGLYRYGYDYGQSEAQATARDNYPQSQVAELAAADPAARAEPLADLAARAEAAAAHFRQGTWMNSKLQQVYLIECGRMSVMARALLTAAEIVTEYRNCRAGEAETKAGEMLSQANRRLGELMGNMDELFLAIEEHREVYLQPHMLRELSLMREFVVKLREELQGVARGVANGEVKALPELRTMVVQPIPWVG